MSGKKLQMAQAKSKMENGEKLHYMGEIIDIAMTGSWGFLFFSRFSFPALYNQSKGFLSLTASTADSWGLLGCQQGLSRVNSAGH